MTHQQTGRRKLTERQLEFLRDRVSTTRERTDWALQFNMTVRGFSRKASIVHPTACALQRRGLLDYRGFDPKRESPTGGWYITEAGRTALADDGVKP